MSYTLPKTALTFLDDLAENNTKEWFQANKKRYEKELKGPARELCAAVNAELAAISPAHTLELPHKALNRINRDIRFSKDKTPYNTRLWAGFHDTSAPKGGGAGFYFGISPDSCGVGCGCWMPPKPFIDNLRAHIAAHHDDLTAAIAALPDGYSEPRGEMYKRVPKPYPADHPAAELLKHKGIHFVYDMDRSLAATPEFVPTVAARFREMLPVVEFLTAGLRG